MTNAALETAGRRSDLPRVLRRVVGFVRFTRERVGAVASSVFILDPSERRLRGLMSEWDWTRTSFSSRLDDWPNVAAAIADGEIRALSATEARGAEAGWFEARGIVTTVCVPLASDGRTFGVLFFDFGRSCTPGAEELAVLSDAGRRCARALARHGTS